MKILTLLRRMKFALTLFSISVLLVQILSGQTDEKAISFDSKAILVNGERQLIISGEMHYSRSPRELWPQLLDRSKNMGLNCVASYIFWNFHEPQKDVYDFSGQRDLGYFLRLCKERELNVILRIGPYCCAEWNFGGYPPYLREEPGITLRTFNRPYMQRVEKYFEHLAAEIRPYLATNGGPVIMVQVENEYLNIAKRYGEEGQRYLRWVVDLAKRLGLDVQTITCEGGAPGSVECVNGHSIPLQRIEKHKTLHPDQPLIWTELWPGWYDTWGFQHHIRDPRNIAYHLLSFLTRGGTGWNYYMWHGGTNFGRTAMYLQTTSYDFDAPLDEYGKPSLKGVYLERLHKAVLANKNYLLQSERVQQILPSGLVQTTWKGDKDFIILINNTDKQRKSGKIEVSPFGGCILDSSGKVIFDVQGDYAATQKNYKTGEWNALVAPGSWKAWHEPFPVNRTTGFVSSSSPLEQLGLTHDNSDYCWYSSRFNAVPGEQKLEIPYGGDFFYIYVDGKLVSQSQPPFLENRGSTMPDDADNPPVYANMLEELKLKEFHHTFTLTNVGPGVHRIDILSVALGLVKGDWQISGSMNTERKGIWQDILMNGEVIKDWEMRPYMEGEKLNIVNTPSCAGWTTLNEPQPCTWYKTEFSLAPGQLHDEVHYRIDATGLGKGMLFLNGHALGRYWLIEANGYGADKSWHEEKTDGLGLAPAGKPTQQYYHVPRGWLKTENQLIIFEEQAASPVKVSLQTRINE